ncbi:unnamed protein product [Echinostoma caproni]|uniref:SET domain-containing protein n=1 Tax=Echinostoma caproni TaxID=27848 RepID=A0A183B247_9TREM|nr:unnamed protein product [Echinostoma caproni]
MSNSRHAIDCIPVGERAPSLRELQGSPLPIGRAIGVQWDSEKDEVLFQLQVPETTMTRKGILSSLASIYDPIEFVTPWLLPGTILMQDLCRKRVTWDETLCEADHKTWPDCWLSLSKLGDIRLPRSIPGIFRGEAIELHDFADASEVGYGVVAYGFSSRPGGRRHNSILFAKARVAPLKPDQRMARHSDFPCRNGVTRDYEDRYVSGCFKQHLTAEAASFFTMDEGAKGGCLVDQIQTTTHYPKRTPT